MEFSVLTLTFCIDRIRIGNGDIPMRLAAKSRAVIGFAHQRPGQAALCNVVAHQDTLAVRLYRPNFKHVVFQRGWNWHSVSSTTRPSSR